MTARLLIGDVFDRLVELPDGSVDLVLTSPPFLALRSYLPSDHPNKSQEIGSESTPADYLDILLALTAEWDRVLAPHGSICVELGDTYAGSGGAGGDYNPDGLREGQQRFDGSATRNRLAPHSDQRGNPDGMRDTTWSGANTRSGSGPGWPLDKSLTFIPQLYGASLAYGHNLLNGTPSPAGQWRIRNLVAWVRPNPPVGRLGDKFRPATSYLTVACRARDRWFDLDAVRTPSDYNQHGNDSRAGDHAPGQRPNHSDHTTHPAGTPPLDWWEIPPKGYSGAHYAVWPENLCTTPIDSMCPRRVCVTCGQPSRRITTTAQRDTGCRTNGRKVGGAEVLAGGKYDKRTVSEHTTTIGWTTCGCPDTDGLRLDGFHTGHGWRPGVVLDPFAGTGTTLAVASGHSRDCIGIDLDPRNTDHARQRLGMFLDITPTQPPAPTAPLAAGSAPERTTAPHAGGEVA